MGKYILLFIYVITYSLCSAQDNIIPLWSEMVPNQKESVEGETQKHDDIYWIGNVQTPTLEIYLPTKRNATGRAVIICPGGAYHHLAYDYEGTDIAKWFNSKGIAAFVLKYRLPESKSLIINHKAPLQDAQRALRIVRYNAEKWGISQDQIGVVGFSAGGHLASTLGTHYNDISYDASDDMDRLSARPDFMVLIYPVITMNPLYTHEGSKISLLGTNPNAELVNYYSNELHVNSKTPPTFILHGADDKSVSVMNSILFFEALQKEGIFTEMHIFPEGGHGFSLAIGKDNLQDWTNLLSEWIDNLK